MRPTIKITRKCWRCAGRRRLSLRTRSQACGSSSGSWLGGQASLGILSQRRSSSLKQRQRPLCAVATVTEEQQEEGSPPAICPSPSSACTMWSASTSWSIRTDSGWVCEPSTVQDCAAAPRALAATAALVRVHPSTRRGPSMWVWRCRSTWPGRRARARPRGFATRTCRRPPPCSGATILHWTVRRASSARRVAASSLAPTSCASSGMGLPTPNRASRRALLRCSSWMRLARHSRASAACARA
jgi:hypothetical protein